MDGSATHRRRAGRRPPLALERLEDRSLFAGLSALNPDYDLAALPAAVVRPNDSAVQAQDASASRSAATDSGVGDVSPIGRVSVALSATGTGAGRFDAPYLVSLDRDAGPRDSSWPNRMPDRDDGPAEGRRVSLVEAVEREERLAMRRDVPATPADLSPPLAKSADTRAADVWSATPAPAVNAVQPAPPPAEATAAVAGGVIADRPTATGVGGKADVTPTASPPAVEPDPAATVQPPAPILPDSTAEAALPAHTTTGGEPIGGWLPVDVTALERGVDALLSRLDLKTDGEPRWAIVRLAVSIAGAWAAYEVVRLRRTPRPRPAAADLPGWLAGGPWPEDGE